MLARLAWKSRQFEQDDISMNLSRDGIQTSSFGLGTDFDAALMSRIADRGAGGYYYLADSSQITPALRSQSIEYTRRASSPRLARVTKKAPA